MCWLFTLDRMEERAIFPVMSATEDVGSLLRNSPLELDITDFVRKEKKILDPILCIITHSFLKHFIIYKTFSDISQPVHMCSNFTSRKSYYFLHTMLCWVELMNKWISMLWMRKLRSEVGRHKTESLIFWVQVWSCSYMSSPLRYGFWTCTMEYYWGKQSDFPWCEDLGLSQVSLVIPNHFYKLNHYLLSLEEQ